MRIMKTKRLCVLWIITYLIWMLFCRFYEAIVIANTGTSPAFTFGAYRIVGLALVLCYFYPLSIIIRKNAIKESMTKIVAISSVAIIVQTLWIVASIVTMCLALFP